MIKKLKIKELVKLSEIERVVYDIERLSQSWEIKTEPARNATDDYIKHVVKLYVPKGQRKEYLKKWEDEKRKYEK